MGFSDIPRVRKHLYLGPKTAVMPHQWLLHHWLRSDSFSMDDAHVSHDIWAASRSFHGNDKVVCAVMCIARSLQRTCTFTALRIMQPSHGVCLFMMLLVRRAQKPTDGDDLSRQ